MIGGRNITKITQFILLGFSDFPQITALLFVMFLTLYITALTWNLSLVVLIRMDSYLHTPMYFFLSNLSFIDICYISSTVPKMLSNLFQEKQTISFVGCIVQNSSFSPWGWVSLVSWQPWPMTGMLPFVTLFCMHRLCHPLFVYWWCWHPISLGSLLLYYSCLLCFVSIFVELMSSSTSFVTCHSC